MHYSARGFSLIEVAIVMLIMGSLLSGLLVTITQTTENSRRNIAENKLNSIQEALYGFAQVNGRLPCPATSDSNGLENPVGGGVCTSYHGFVPHATLSLYGQTNTDSLLTDPWTNPYRYSVADMLANGNPAFTSTAGVDFLFSNPLLLAENANLIEVCSTNSCADDEELSDTVPAVVFSMGDNWQTTNSNCTLVFNPADDEADESLNAGAVLDATYCLTDNMDFVSRTYVQDVFDDVIIWLSPHVLFGKLISAGQLP